MKAHETAIVERLTPIIEKYFPKKSLDSFLNKNYQEAYPDMKVVASVFSNDHYVTKVQINVVTGKPEKDMVLYSITQFTISNYPSCCAFYTLHSFSYTNKTPENFLHDVISAVVAELRNYGYIPCRRLLCAMVEKRRAPVQSLSGSTNSEQVLKEGMIPQNGPIEYPFFKSWFEKQIAVVDKVVYNYNTGNIIHLLDVAIK